MYKSRETFSGKKKVLRTYRAFQKVIRQSLGNLDGKLLIQISLSSLKTEFTENN